jgi:hypothetical protein
LLIFPMPTHTHDFGNHSDGNGRTKTAFVRSSADCRKSNLSMGLSLGTVTDSGGIYDFSSCY